MTNLKVLRVGNAFSTEEGLERLKKALPSADR